MTVTYNTHHVYVCYSRNSGRSRWRLFGATFHLEQARRFCLDRRYLLAKKEKAQNPQAAYIQLLRGAEYEDELPVDFGQDAEAPGWVVVEA